MKYLIVLVFLISAKSYSQNTRIKDNNTIGWYNVFTTTKINNKVSIHGEYQWRRDELIKNWQQSLLRIGINYQTNPFLQFRFGYGWIETFNYGDFAINVYGKPFTEHRFFEVVTLNTRVNTLDLQHRFMLEQRFIGRYTNAALTKEDEFVYLNRFRYLVRLQKAFSNNAKKHAYAAAINEFFIGFGKNVNENIFDQNRITLLLGQKINSSVRVEGGFLSQIVQLPREINGRNVFQYNNGVIINLVLQLNATKKATAKK